MTSKNAETAASDAWADAQVLFSGPGDVRALARALDWSGTVLGPSTGWSPALRMMAKSIFDSPFPDLPVVGTAVCPDL